MTGVQTCALPICDATVKRFLEQWQNSFGGRSKSNKVAFLGNGLKLDQSVGGGAKELDFANQQKMMRDDILAIFKVPKTILGLTEDVNKANAEATTRAFMERVITPRMRKFVETLNEFLVPMYGQSNLFLDFTDPSPEDVETKLKYYENASKWGWMTPNEIRAEENKEPIEGGDVLPLPKANPLETPIPATEEPTGKNILNKISRLFKNKEQIKVKTTLRKPTKKKFKHMVQIPVKRLEVLDREKLEKNLTPLVTKFIGDMLKKTKVDNLGIMSNSSQKDKGSSTSKRVFTPELKDAYWKAFIKQAKEDEETLYEEIIGIFKQQEKDVVNNLNNTVRYWHKNLRKGKESSVIPSLREMILAWQSVSILIKELIYSKGEQVLDFLGIGGKLNLSTDSVTYYLKQKDIIIKDINQVTRKQLKETLAEGFNNGDSISLLTIRVQDVFKQATRNRARMIARTESIRALNFATLEGYRQSEIVEAQEWLAERDERTCEYCQEMDGKVIALNKDWFKKGDTFEVDGNSLNINFTDIENPPLHPLCRCTLIPVFVGEKSLVEKDQIEKKINQFKKIKRVEELKQKKEEAITDKISSITREIKDREVQVLESAKEKALLEKKHIIEQAKRKADLILKQVEIQTKKAKKTKQELTDQNIAAKQKKADLLLKESEYKANKLVNEAHVKSKTIIEKATELAIKKKNEIINELKSLRDKARETIYGQNK